MSLPPSDFAATFRALVVPRLRPIIEAHGLFLALDVNDFSQSFNELMREATRLGANNLPDEHFSALSDWIGAELLRVMAAKEQPVNDKVWRDISSWNAKVLAHFAIPEVADAR